MGFPSGGRVVQSLSCAWLFVTTWTAARQASLSFSVSESLLKFVSIGSVIPGNHLSLCLPLLLSPSVFASIRIFAGSSVVESTCQHRRLSTILGLGKSPAGGNGNPFQYSCLGTLMDRGAWWATDHEVTKSWIQLSDWACVHLRFLDHFYILKKIFFELIFFLLLQSINFIWEG